MLLVFFAVAISINLCLAHIREVGAESFEELGVKVMNRILMILFLSQVSKAGFYLVWAYCLHASRL